MNPLTACIVSVAEKACQGGSSIPAAHQLVRRSWQHAGQLWLIATAGQHQVISSTTFMPTNLSSSLLLTLTWQYSLHTLPNWQRSLQHLYATYADEVSVLSSDASGTLSTSQSWMLCEHTAGRRWGLKVRPPSAGNSSTQYAALLHNQNSCKVVNVGKAAAVAVATPTATGARAVAAVVATAVLAVLAAQQQ